MTAFIDVAAFMCEEPIEQVGRRQTHPLVSELRGYQYIPQGLTVGICFGCFSIRIHMLSFEGVVR
jgi:hypothetical protein